MRKSKFLALNLAFYLMSGGIFTHCYAEANKGDAETEISDKKSSKNTSSTLGDYSIQEGRDFVELIGTKIVQLLQEKGISRQEQETRYRQILDEHFDMPAIAAYTLGRYKSKLSGAELEEFVKLFTDLTVQYYVDQFSQYKNQTLKLKNRENKKGPYLVVDSYIEQKEGKNIEVQWLIKKRGGNLAVYELIVEGVGLRNTKRNIYSSTLRVSGIEALMKNLKDELSRYGSPNHKQ